MKRKLKLILCLIVLLFFKGNNFIFGQRIIEYKGDTLIVITPQNVATMNSIIVERDYLEKEVFILNDLNILKDSTIKEQKQIISFTEESLLHTKAKNELVVQEQAYTWKKRVWTWSGVSATVGLILGILLAK